MDRQNSRNVKLTIKFILLISICIGLLGTVSYNYFKGVIIKNEIGHNLELVELVSENLDDSLEDVEKNLKILSTGKEIENIKKKENHDSVQNLLKRFEDYKKVHEDVKNIYLGTINKKFYMHPYVELPDSYDPTKREWYVEASNNKDYVWSKPYVDAKEGRLMDTLTMPIYNNENLIGVLGVDMDVNFMEEKIVNARIGESGYMILVDGEGHVVIHPDKSAIGKLLPIDELRENVMRDHEMGTIKYRWNGSEEIAFYSKMHRGNFTVIGFLPKEELYHDIDGFLKMSILISVITGLIMISLSVLITRGDGKKQEVIRNKKTLEIEDSQTNDLKNKLDRLKAHKTQGTLTYEEYECKRADIIKKYEI